MLDPKTREEKPDLEIQLLRPEAKPPTRAYHLDAGLDLYAANAAEILPQQSVMVPTGIALAIAEGYVGLVADRSSYARRGLKTAGGVIDAGYRGEIVVILWNLGQETLHISCGDKIAQLLIIPVATPTPVVIDRLSTSQRGEKGFGSSGH